MPATVLAAKRGAPDLSLRDGQSVTTNYEGDTSAAGALQNNLAIPLALASADFDGDGVPDLVSGYSTGSSGIITIHRGNVDALWPYGAALRNGEPPAFLPVARILTVPEPPDFIGVGDFDADGHWDIVTAHLGSNAMYFLRGDGRGGFASPVRVALAGSITAFTTGEMNRADGLMDIALGISTANGARALVFESPLGALSGTPEAFVLPSPATSMVLGLVEGGPMRDLAIGAGNQLVVIHGRDRRLSLGTAAQAGVAPANITRQVLPFNVRALALGHFSDTASLAALGDDGAIHLIQNANAIAQRIKLAGVTQRMQVSARGAARKPAPVQATTSASRAQKAAVLQNLRQALAGNHAEWKIEADVQLPSSAAHQGAASFAKLMVPAHVSTSHYDDLLLLDNQARQVHVISSRTTRISNASVGVTAQTVSQPMGLTASLDASGVPAAVLPMRLNKYGLQSMVVLQGGQAGPTILPQAPANIFTVTNTSDIASSSLSATIPPGSLRAAITNATNSDGPSEIDFDIPTSDPNYNAATGTFLIQPLSTVPPGNLDDFALPPIGGTTTVDAYTQPGASPNTMVTGDNAKILIQIDGSLAVTPGGEGLTPLNTSETVIRGFSITGWISEDLSTPDMPTGGIGLAEGGVSDYMEGNFVGVDPDGKTANPNSEGVNEDAGPEIGAPSAAFGGDVLGGTTPQARNVISGNAGEGVVAEPGSYFLQIQGNYVGTDLTGTVAVLNNGDGVFIPGEEITIGGTLPGAGNLISGNTNYNLDIGNAYPNGSAANDIAQGNFIGTDATGTVSLTTLGEGVGIVNIASNITLGGTTSAARNVISGNNFLGVDLSDNSSNAIIQGNYIGLDVTGTVAVPNGLGGVGANNIPSGGISINTHTFISAGGTPFLYPPFNNAIGGGVQGAGNVISGNGGDGVSIMGWDNNDPNEANPNNLSNYVLGNFIGTDVTGANSVPNTQNGVYLTIDAEAASPAAHNAIGGTDPGLGNTISFNGGDGVLIDGTSFSNPIVENKIQNNSGTGVRVASGAGNTISRNSIFGNGALGIELGSAQNANSSCQSVTNGANNLQNTPVLTAGSGANFITATATDPNGNTSEFSNAVAASISGNILSLLGNFNSLPNTTYTIEFFTSPSADPSGFGQGQTYLNSTSVTTSASCTGPINMPINLTEADVSVALSFSENGSTSEFAQLAPGTDFGTQVYTGVVTNNGPATAHNVVFTDALPAGLAVSSMYCNLPSCQSPLSTDLGNCTVSTNTVTCPLGTMAPGSSATIKIPVQALATGTITNTVTAFATETDPNTANNTASDNVTSQNPFTQVTQVSPTGLLTTSPDTPVIVYGTGFLPGVSTVTFTDPNNVSTNLPVTAFYDNQTCGVNSNVSTTSYCQGFQVTLPSSLIGTAGAASFTVTNPGGPFALSGPFTLASSCDFGSPFAFYTPPYDFSNAGTGIIPFELDVSPNVPSCTFTASSNVPWAVLLNNSPEPFVGVPGTFVVDFAIAPNPGAGRAGTLTVAGQNLAITQDADDGSVCSILTNPTSATLPATAGTYSVQVTPSNSSCGYFNQSSSPWITVASADGLLVGSGTVSYTVTANTGGPQTGDIVIGGQAFVITQNPATSCYFTLSSNSATFPTIAGTGSVNVIASQPSCSWTATTDSPSYVSFTSGASGTGNGTIQYSVGANTGGGRNAIITVANTSGASVMFNINQASTYACSVTLIPTSIELPAEGASNEFTVSPAFNTCSWTAVSNNPSALTITSGNSGSGNSAEIIFAVGQNTTGAPRTLTITAGCQTFTVFQDGPGTTNPVPVIVPPLVPASVVAGSGAFTLTVNGSSFVNGATATFGGVSRAVTFVNSGQVTIAVQASDVASVGTPAVVVTNPAPGGGASNTVDFSVTAVALVPTTTAVMSNNNPSVLGQSVMFTAGVTPSEDPLPLPSGTVTFKDGTTTLGTGTLSSGSTTFSTSSLAAGSHSITAVYGGDSNYSGSTSLAISQVVNNPVPVITPPLVPASAFAGSAGFTLTVNGSNFVSGATATFGGTSRAVTFVSSTQVTIAVLATDIATAGTPAVIVSNPGPGGGASNSVNFAVNNPVPVIIPPLVPAGVVAGSGAFTLTVNGSSFVNGATATFGGISRAVTFVNSGQVTIAVQASDVASVGTPAVVVTNPAPVGGASNSVAFNVTAANNPVPALTSLVPNSASAGSGAFTLMVNGSGFVNGSVVQWNGSNRTTTFVNSGQVTASITAADVQTATIADVTVFNPTPGGGSSNSLNFDVTTPVPALASLVPNSAIAGSPAFTLTVNGSNFISTSEVQWNGSTRATTFVNAGQLTASITAADIQTAGTATVTVFTPTVDIGVVRGVRPAGAPSGTTSNPLTFTINAANPAPTLTSLVPNSATAGGAAFTLTLNGTNFISSSVAQWNGSARTTTFVSATQVTAAITAADIASAGTASVTVMNPTPGGGTSNALTFTITDFSVANASGAQTEPAGTPAKYTINAAGVDGNFPGTVTFSASNLPPATTASFSPMSVAPGAGTAPTTLTLTTTARGTTTHVIPSAPNGTPKLPQLALWLGVMSLLGMTLLVLRRSGRLAPRAATTAFLVLDNNLRRGIRERMQRWFPSGHDGGDGHARGRLHNHRDRRVGVGAALDDGHADGAVMGIAEAMMTHAEEMTSRTEAMK